MTPIRVAALVAAAAGMPVALAYRFARVYRQRAGFPRQSPPRFLPSDLGLAFEDLAVETPDGVRLPAWFMPAAQGRPGPGVVLVHGWESARDRTLPNAQFLVAAGFHCLTIDVRGHGLNPPETLPVSTGEFGVDAGAAFAALLARPEVTSGALLGHSMGAVGALLAAAADPRVVAVVATSTPADPYRLTRQTFRLAHLPLPDPVAYPLAWLTTRVFLKPRRHVPGDISATRAVAAYDGPVMLVHGSDDRVVPLGHLDRLDAAARAARGKAGTDVERLVIDGGQHSWLYESSLYRASVARFLATTLDGSITPDEAAAAADAVDARRLPDAEATFSAIADEPGGVRTLAGAVAPRRRNGRSATTGPADQAGPLEAPVGGRSTEG